MENVCIYLRKSRADEEIEKSLGEGETLSRHKKTLLEYAEKHQLGITRIREEVVSGESIIYRSEMLQLLKEVELGMYNAVLCMDLQRLGRGDMEEQGIILKTFKRTNTKIITPDRTYDLSNEFDEEYSEFEAFMSRKEYKMITRRMQRGVMRSVNDGNYMPPSPPFGYVIYSDAFSRTLEPHPQQAGIVKLIFDWYSGGNQGCSIIASRLNNMGVKTSRGNDWTHNAVCSILKNPVYTGKITWKKRNKKKSGDLITVNGKHKALVDKAVFEKVQDILASRTTPPAKSSAGLANPLAGLVVCKICKSKMKYRKYKSSDPHIICTGKCGNKSAKFEFIENSILAALRKQFSKCKIEIALKDSSSNLHEVYEKNLEQLNRELNELKKQKEKLHDFLEQGVYDVDTFNCRLNSISSKIIQLEKAICVNTNSIEAETSSMSAKISSLCKLSNLADIYHAAGNIETRNLVLKSIIDRIEYYKPSNQKDDNFELSIYTKL